VNCTVIQRRLLSAEQPEQPPPDIKNHLAQCPACRTWHRRLIQMERLIPQLPVPPSTAKEQFLDRIVGPRTAEPERPTIADPSTVWRSTLTPGPKERGQRKLSVAFALAASLLVFALALWSWPRSPTDAIDLRRNEQVKLEQRLSDSLQFDSPKERVQRLAKLAEEIHGESRSLVNNSERLEQWAQFYARIIGEYLIEQARQVPPADRQTVLEEVAVRLAKMESDASRFAAQVKRTTPRSAASFHRIALASRQGEQDLRALMKG
jgi:hypothetical protein